MSETRAVDGRSVSRADVALFIVRLALAFVFVAHGSQKLFGAFGGYGIAGTGGYFSSFGLNPGEFWATVVGLVEFLGGIALALGLLTRIASLFLLADMVGAIVTYNWVRGFFVEDLSDGGWEYNFVLIAVLISIVLTGAGALSIDQLLRSRATGRLARVVKMV